ncbi:MAG: hypothetical protein QCI00_07265, partial [Candidatus Thermoplasmatota archaeon]|nr:hypothetical protein [Candidatus Thermoplasmatota archaeon]
MLNNFKKRLVEKTLFTLLLILLVSQSAQASIYYGSNGAINVIDENEVVTITDINKTLYSSYGYDLVERLDDRVWLVKKPLYIGNATVLIDGNIDAREVRFSSSISRYGGKGEIMTEFPSISKPRIGELIIKNTTINTWNSSINKPEYIPEKMVRIFISNGLINNVTFEAVDEVKLYKGFSTDVFDVKIKNSFEGLNLEYLDGIKLSNIDAINISFTGITLASCSNIEVSDYYFFNHEIYRTPYVTSANGIILGYGDSNYVHDVNIIGPRWGGVYTTGSESNSKFENISISSAGHNGIDIHGGENLTYKNIVSAESASNNYLISGTSVPVNNVTIENFVSINPSARGLVGGWAVDNVNLKNYTSVGPASTSIQFFNASNISIMEFKSMDSTIDSALQLTYVGGYGTNNVVLIDSILTQSDYKDIWFTGLNTNNTIINSKFDNLRSATSVDYSNGYYLDLLTIYENGTTYSNSKVEVESNHPAANSLNGFGLEKNIFNLDSYGQVQLTKNDRSNSPVLKDYYRLSAGQESFSIYNLNILSSNGYKVSSLGEISPDYTWYREDPNAPTYTITAIIPNESTTGPQLTGFAPSEDNPFIAGENKKFRVWCDEDL